MIRCYVTGENDTIRPPVQLPHLLLLLPLLLVIISISIFTR